MARLKRKMAFPAAVKPEMRDTWEKDRRQLAAYRQELEDNLAAIAEARRDRISREEESELNRAEALNQRYLRNAEAAQRRIDGGMLLKELVVRDGNQHRLMDENEQKLALDRKFRTTREEIQRPIREKAGVHVHERNKLPQQAEALAQSEWDDILKQSGGRYPEARAIRLRRQVEILAELRADESGEEE